MSRKRKEPEVKTENLSYERLEGETVRAFNAFRIYRDLGPQRSIDAVRISLGRPESYNSNLYNWSRFNSWVARSKLYDDWVDSCQRQNAQMEMPKWEKRRQEALESNIALAERMRERVQEMLEHPLTKERVEFGANGRTTTYILPANWNWSSIATVAKTMAELTAATIAEGLIDEEASAFDPTTASLEECRAYIQKIRNRTKGRADNE